MTSHRPFTRNDLVQFKPKFTTFVGIDSDGCVFDTMDVKQKEHFHGLIIRHWHLEPIDRYVREAAEFVSLHSQWRGSNRYPALVRIFDVCRERPEVRKSGVRVPELSDLRRFIVSGATLSNAELAKLVRETGNKELASVLEWSQAINADIARHMKPIPPFPWARRSLERIRTTSDAICVSQTPTEALVKEWSQHGMTQFVALIAGQELGTKSEHIALATRGKYAAGKVLMIGDAPGDRRAARENRAHFYPINPGGENTSWERFHQEAYDRFLQGTYGGDYENRLIAEFDRLLPENPPWTAKSW